MIGKAQGYGYKKIGFILDMGYFGKENIEYMDACGYSFVIMVKGMASFVNKLVLEQKGSFEDKRANCIHRYDVYGTTVSKKLYATDEKDRYFHIYYNLSKAASERNNLEDKIERLTRLLKKQIGREYIPSDTINDYFELFFSRDGVLVAFREKQDVIERGIRLCGYFVLVTSQKMTAKEAIDLYKSRDTSEKLFAADKSFLGNKSYRTHTNESTAGKIFVEFIALVIRCRIYTRLKDEAERLEDKPNYMTVPAAIKELEKIEMLRGYDNVYHLDHAVTATQKVIHGAFDISDTDVKNAAKRISEKLQQARD